jgi:hypothetical protein
MMKMKYKVKEVVEKTVEIDEDFFYADNRFGYGTDKSKHWEELCYAVVGSHDAHDDLVGLMYDLDRNSYPELLISDFNEKAKMARKIFLIFYPEER